MYINQRGTLPTMNNETPIITRNARDGDLDALAALDATYETREVLALRRAGDGAVLRIDAEWRATEPRALTYSAYPAERLRGAMSKADCFFVAESGDELLGLLMIMLPAWTNAGEITDLLVGREHRRSGAGAALVGAATEFARGRSLRALWVEPRTNNAAAIRFYLRQGFRISGYNDRMYSNGDDADGAVTLLMHLDVEAVG